MTFDTRIPADHPAIPYLTTFPTFYVGQCVIDDGADAVWSFALGYVVSAEITALQRAAVELLTDKSVPAAVQSGDSPGSDTWIHVGDLGGGYVGVYAEYESVPEEGPPVIGGPRRWYLSAYDPDGNPVGPGPKTIGASTAEGLAAAVSLYWHAATVGA